MTERAGRDAGFAIEEHGAALVVAASMGIEMDMSVAPLLRRALDTALDAHPETLVIDLSAAAFVDSTCLGEMVVAGHAADEVGIRLALVADNYAVTRPVTLLGLDRLIPLYATCDEALTAP